MSSIFVSPGAALYESYMGRWSRRLAEPFLDFAGLAAGEHVVDIGCGTGSLTFALPRRAAVALVEAIDYEQEFVAAAQAQNSDERIHIRQGDACALPFADGRFDRAFSMLVMHFVSDPPRAAREMHRVLRPGGVAAAAVWDTFGGQPGIRMFWDIAATLFPAAAQRRNAALIRSTTRPGELRYLFENAGFADVAETLLTIRMDFENFDDYWIPQSTGHGATKALIASLPDTTRRTFESAIRDSYLCGAADGPRSFVSAAWTVRGVRPDR